MLELAAKQLVFEVCEKCRLVRVLFEWMLVVAGNKGHTGGVWIVRTEHQDVAQHNPIKDTQ
ncbi:hypothetical protein D3C80_2205280 [compost metagenome]